MSILIPAKYLIAAFFTSYLCVTFPRVAPSKLILTKENDFPIVKDSYITNNILPLLKLENNLDYLSEKYANKYKLFDSGKSELTNNSINSRYYQQFYVYNWQPLKKWFSWLRDYGKDLFDLLKGFEILGQSFGILGLVIFIAIVVIGTFVAWMTGLKRAEIHNNVTYKYDTGMLSGKIKKLVINFTISVYNAQFYTCNTSLYFYDKNGNKLYTKDGQHLLLKQSFYISSHEFSKDFEFLLYYSQLRKTSLSRGDHNISFQVVIWDNSGTLVESNKYSCLVKDL